MRMKNQNKDYHYFATNFVFDRINVNSLDATTPINPEISMKQFLANQDELCLYKKSLKILLARELGNHLSGFDWMCSVTPDHISHKYTEQMSQKSSIHILPVSLKNEAKYSDCIHILDEYVGHINRWYTKGGRGNYNLY